MRFNNLIICIMTTLCFSCNMVAVPEISTFNAQKYIGKWYEIARLDHSFERGLDSVTAFYQLRNDGKIDVTNRGYDTANRKWKEAHAYAKQTDILNYLKVYFVPLIAGKYRIAYIDEEYSVALVSGGTLKYLWFLSRTPQISEEQKEILMNEAGKLGYDTSKLIFVPQNDKTL